MPNYISKVRKILHDLDGMANHAQVPAFRLNDHCEICGYRDLCRAKAQEDDDLSLLKRMSDKQIRKYNSKGIFSVTQLSYTYRPRRRSKRQKHLPHPYSFPLKALAIREKRIHVVGAPVLQG